jgi:hypothetical protein
MTKTRIGRNIGRIEFAAAFKKIQKLLEAGYDRKKIHSQLAEKGLVTMSYGTFCAQMKKFKARLGFPFEVGQHAEAACEAPPQTAKPAPTPISTRAVKDEPFTLNRNPNANDLI